MEFKYWGRTFTSPEEVEAYDAELWKNITNLIIQIKR